MGLSVTKLTRSSDIGSKAQQLSWTSSSAWQNITWSDGGTAGNIIEVVSEYSSTYQYQLWVYQFSIFTSLIDIGGAAVKMQIQDSGGTLQLSPTASATIKAVLRVWGYPF